MGTKSGAIKFSVQYFIDMGRRCSLDSITASCMVLRVCPLSVSILVNTPVVQMYPALIAELYG